jgi:hypothetical protein
MAMEFHVINTMIGRSRQASLTSGPTRLTQLKLQPARQTQAPLRQRRFKHLSWIIHHKTNCRAVTLAQGTPAARPSFVSQTLKITRTLLNPSVNPEHHDRLFGSASRAQKLCL